MEKLILTSHVAYADVDRQEVLLLASVFKLLQEGAIKHADHFGMGTQAMGRGESWVLNRMALSIHRYPRYGDALRLETWSSGINGFRGYREYRAYCGEEPVISGSSLWLYINVATKSLIRVTPEHAATFPSLPTPAFLPGIDRLTLPTPASDAPCATTVPVSVRYSDLDGNGHVNNTAYIDFLQTALVRAGLPASPRDVQIKFSREIPPETETVTVLLEPRGDAVLFAIGAGDALFANGQVR